MTSEISAGFLEDCHVFMQRFSVLNSINFHDFCTVWNDMNFHCIFYGRQSIDDLNTFVEEALIIVKRIFIRSTSLIEKCCCLFLLYSIYQKQPDKYVAKIRVTESDWIAFKNFYAELKDEGYQHAFIIFWKLLHDDSYHFCLYESKYLLDGQSKSDKDKSEGLDTQLQFKPISGSILHELESLQTNHGIMSALEALEIAYNEMKESLDQSNDLEEDNDDVIERTLPPSALVKDINDAIVDIQDLFTHSRPNRTKKKKARKVTETSRSEFDEEHDEKGRGKQSIKDKRKSIKDRAFKEIKKKRGSVTDSKNREQPSCSSQETIETPVKQKVKPIVDQIHFKKITEVQKIFEMNSLLEQENNTTIAPTEQVSSTRPKKEQESLRIKKDK